MSVLKNTNSIELSSKEVNDADEDIVKPVGKGFVRQFHHFKYAGPGVVLCQYIKGKGPSVRREMSQSKGMHMRLMLYRCLLSRCALRAEPLRWMWRPMRGHLLPDLPDLQAAVSLWLHWRGWLCCWRWFPSSIPMWLLQWFDRKSELFWWAVELSLLHVSEAFK